jgi:hypothetical protein
MIVESTSGKKKLIRTLAALANAGGGTAVVGIQEDDDEPVIQGFDQNAETRQTLTHVAQEHTFPPVLRVWDLSFDEHCGEYLLRIDVERPDEEPIRYTGAGEDEYPIRHEDNTVKMSQREIVEFVQESHTQSASRKAPRSVSVEQSTSVDHDPPTVEADFPAMALDRVVTAAPDGHTVVFGGGILEHRYRKSTVYSLSRRPKSLDGYHSVPDLLDTAREYLGAQLGRQFGYTFRVGNAQLVGNSLTSLREDLERLEAVATTLGDRSTAVWNYGPSLTGFFPTEFGLLWFAVQDEGEMKRWDLELLCPDVPLDGDPVREFFATVATEPQFYDHQTGTKFVEVVGHGVELRNPVSVGCLGDPDRETTHVLADNPLYGWPDEVSSSFDPPLPDLLSKGIESLPRLPLDVSGGFIEGTDGPSYSLNTLNYCRVSGEHPTLLVQGLCWQHSEDEQSFAGVL